ncbi:Chain length determinant protein [Nocardioides dokdonensis FR1436]|uniref:Chain length determinant protein n=1 Tax=Nocardioides dokdonensis FR1436 TaxID=1300347 RepID=A0A1A9GFU1_9ACTN|nr:hypothetical protein [Nocardioides dokdonensis]ANH36560.1 Chain length determinant protein [Nocardioides dokdonensis FR1436]
MAEQALDLRVVWSVLRRHLRLLAVAALLGAVAGVALATWRPPVHTSTSMVLLPLASDSGVGRAERDAETEVRVATSDLVLGEAGLRLSPELPLAKMAQHVTVSASTPDVLRFTARHTDAELAQAMAQEAAAAELRYVGSAAARLRNAAQAGREARLEALRKSLRTVDRDIRTTTDRRDDEPYGSAAEKAMSAALAQLTAQQASLVLQIDQVAEAASADVGRDTASLIQKASPPRSPGLLVRRLVAGALGLVAGVVLLGMVLVGFARRDRRLRYRDEIADALGSAVLASVVSRPARTVAGWRTLLGRYEPGTVDAWALRQTLRHVLPADFPLGQTHDKDDVARAPVEIAVVSLSDDPGALALGPQLASYAAGAGVSTRLVPHRGHDSAAGLWAACARVHPEHEVRSRLWINRPTRDEAPADLTLLMVVIDRAAPGQVVLPPGTHGVVAVSAGTATAVELARVAVSVDEADVVVAGLVVLDPDRLDRTTGRRLQPDRVREPHLPARLTGLSLAEGGRPVRSGLRGGVAP